MTQYQGRLIARRLARAGDDTERLGHPLLWIGALEPLETSLLLSQHTNLPQMPHLGIIFPPEVLWQVPIYPTYLLSFSVKYAEYQDHNILKSDICHSIPNVNRSEFKHADENKIKIW